MITFSRVSLSVLSLVIFHYAPAQTIDTTLVEFVQGDTFYSITAESASITLGKKPFSIRFHNRRYDVDNGKFHVAQIAVLDKPDNGIEVGMKRDEIPFFGGGTGIAMSADDDYALFITDEGHHYMYYASEEDRRLYLLSKHDEWLKLEWRIKGYFANDKDSDIKDLEYDKLYFIFLFDRNLNETIDEGELKKVVVAFK